MTERLTLRLCPTNDADSVVFADELGRLLLALDAAVGALADAPNGGALERTALPCLTLVRAGARDHVLHLDFDAPDDALLSRFVASAAVFAADPHAPHVQLRRLQRAIPQGIHTIEIAHGAASASIPCGQTGEDSPATDQWIIDLIHRMTHRKAKPFVPFTDDEKLDFDVEEFNRIVAEGRRGSE